MTILRTLSTRRLLVLLTAAAVTAAAAGAVAVTAFGSATVAPSANPPLPQAVHDALAAPRPDGLTARIRFTNNLLPSGGLIGNAGSALVTGASGRLWITGDGRARLELQSDAGDVQIVWDPPSLTAYDSSSNTVYRATLPRDAGAAPSTAGASGPPSLAEVTDLLNRLGADVSLSEATPTVVAGRPAYSMTLSPKRDGGLLSSAELAWDAVRGVPLRAAILAQGSSAPALQLEATDISYGAVPASDVVLSPPSDAKVVDLGSIGKPSSSEAAPVTGLAAVQAAAGFLVAAPDTLAGLTRSTVRLAGPPDSHTVLVVYGQGLGALVVVERAADAEASNGGVFSKLPSVSIAGVTAHELSTQLGTILAWRGAGVDFVIAGSVSPAVAEAAARQLQ